MTGSLLWVAQCESWLTAVADKCIVAGDSLLD